MGILESLFGAERRTYNSADDFWYMPVTAMTPTSSGVRFSDDGAMRSAAVAACVKVLSESVASLPLHVYKRLSNGGKERATQHYLYDLLHNQPNSFMSAYQWVEVAMVHLTLHGNHYSELFADSRGRVAAIQPLMPNLVEPRQTKNGGLEYAVRDGELATERIIPASRMLHIPGLGFNGLIGMSPISYARETIGMALAAEEFGARFFGHGMNPGHIMTMPEGHRFDDEQTQKFMEDLSEKYGGLGKSHKVLVLPAGMNVNNVGIPPEDAQYLETRRFQVEEIARIYRVPLHMINENTKTTSWGTGIESLTLGFVTYTLRPWLTRIEQVLDRKLLTQPERKSYFIEFLIADILRGDQLARSQYYTAAIQNGWMSRNEVRIIENMNPVEGGDEFLVPLNMTMALDEPQNEPEGEPEEQPQRAAVPPVESRVEKRKILPSRYSIQKSYVRVLKDAIERVLRSEKKDVLAATKSLVSKKSAESLEDWLTDFYLDHAEFTANRMRPAMTALAEAVGIEAMREIGEEWQSNPSLDAWLVSYIDGFGRRYSQLQLAELLSLLQTTLDANGDVLGAFEGRFSEWEDDGGSARAYTRARNESVQLGGGFAKMAWAAAGVTTLMWVTNGSSTCPYCESMDGRIIEIHRDFLGDGDAINDMEFSHSIGHPPLHAGCDCMIVPGR